MFTRYALSLRAYRFVTKEVLKWFQLLGYHVKVLISKLAHVRAVQASHIEIPFVLRWPGNG
jgi:hypothetical protein